MINDLKAGPPPIHGHYDHCVIGAGAAGISLALALAAAKKRVILLEGGDRDFTSESQQLYEGDVTGLDTHALDVPRLRYLGGTTGHWTGRVLHRDAADFVPRDDISLSGWPIREQALVPYQSDAAELLGTTRIRRSRRQADDTGTIDIVTQHFSSSDAIFDLNKDEPRRFGAHFARALQDAADIDTLINANFVGFDVDGATGRMISAQVVGYDDARYTISADNFIMAMGGIENTRALLHLNDEYDNRFGNQGDMVGRCFMDHPRLPLGSYFITQRLFSPLPYFGVERLVRRSPKQMVLSPNPNYARRNGFLNGGVWLNFPRRRPLSDDTLDSAPFLRGLTFDHDYFFTGEGLLFAEQAPNPDSRLTLSDNKDRFGLRQAALDWQLLPIDVETMRRVSLEAAEFLIRNGIGRMQIDPSLWQGATSSDIPMMSSSHHMGGTRMSETSQTGVVDTDCRVHGAQNLYVASGAVFPTSGLANPTYTIVQLALRLADHLVAKPA